MTEYVVVGAGSLGQSFAALLARAGQRVTLLATPRTESRLRESGVIRLHGAADAEVQVGPAGVSITSNPDELPPGAAVVFTTKGQDLPAAIEAVRAAAGGRIAWSAGVQNGIVKDDLLVEAFGPDRVIAAVTIFSAQRQSGDSVLVSSRGATYLGELDGRRTDRVQHTATTWVNAGIPTQARTDIQSVLWTKTCNATGVFGATVLARASNQQLFSDPHLMRAYLALVRETAAVAAAYGVEIGDFPGFPTIRTFLDRSDAATIEQLSPGLPSLGPPSYASMTQDVLAGLPLEVDAVFGDVVDRGERKGIPVPCLRLVRDLIRGVDPGHSRDQAAGSAR